MSKEAAQWYLEIVDAFLKNPRLSQWNYLPRGYFLAHLKEIFKEIQEIETFAQAREILQKIINEEVLAPSIPEKDSLEYWQQELEKAKVERRKIKEESIRLVQVQVKSWEEQRKVIVPLVAAVEEEAAKKVPLETEEEKLAKNEASLAQKIQNELENQDKSLTSDPDLSQALAEEVKEIIVSEILFDSDKGIENLSLQIDRKLQERGVVLGQKKGRVFVGNISTAAQPEILKIKEIGEKPLPDEVLIQWSEKTEGAAFTPVYAILQPKVAAAYIEKAIFTPAAKFLKKAEITSPEWKEIVEKGIFAENIQETINTLKEAGLPETHPTIRKLEAKLQKVSKIQKDEKGKDKPGARVFKHYYHFDELTGKPLYDKETKIFLSRKPIWSQGYSLRLREAFNKIGSVFRLYERIPLGPGKTVFHFSLSPKISKFLTFGRYELGAIRATVYRQTIGKAVLALGKTAIGKAVKEGIKKGATWVATRLGIEAGVLAAGVAAAGPTAGISLVIAAAVDIALKIGKIIWNRFFKPIVSAIVRLIKEPEKALGAIIVGAAIVVLVPAAAVFGFALIGLGVLGFLSSLGGILGGVASGVTSFFTALFTIPASTAPVTALVLGTLGGLSALTFFIVMTTAGAFIVPVEPKKAVSAYMEVKKTASPDKIDNSDLPTTINYAVNVNTKSSLIITSIVDQRTINCKGTPPQFKERVDIPPPSGEITSWSTTYTLDIDSSFADCRLCNVVTVTANIPKENISGETASDSQCVNIGQPPEDCPSGWPTDHGYITQGPKANYSHNDPYPQEAIDIGVIVGTPVKATHGGEVEETGGTGLNQWVKVKGSCGGQNFTTLYLHLETINREIQKGKLVSMSQPIGTSGEYKTQQHLHYEFEGLEMAWPNIGYSGDSRIDDILEGCCGEIPRCSSICSSHNVTW